VSRVFANPVIDAAPAAVTRPVSTRRAPAAAPRDRSSLPENAALLATLLVFAISPPMLFVAGINYEATGGNALEKIHPGTFLYIIAFLLFGLKAGNPLQLFVQQLFLYPAAAIFLAVWCVHLAFVVLFLRVPFTPLIDTFLLPILVVWMLGLSGVVTRRRLGVLLHLIMSLNAVIGIAEVATGWRLAPFVVAGIDITDDWRATALFGHPLSNACLGGAYLLALVAGGGGQLPRWLLPGVFLLQLAAMNAFGGRAGLVMCLMGLLVTATGGALRFLNGGRVSLAQVALVAVMIPVGLVAALAVFQGGYLDRMLERFVDDKGSAGTRIAMFNLFDEIPVHDILIGPDPQLIQSLKQIEGLEFGIESFWVGFVLTYGLGPGLMFFAGLFAFFFQLTRGTRPGAWLMVLFFIGIISTSVSISAKTVILAQFAMLVLILLGREGHQTRRSGAGP
jgi:hypothetical protein